MGRDVPFKENKICDGCGATGAYDFMGDYLCQKCSDAPAASGAVDLAACRTQRGHSRTCRCKPVCAACGYGPHMAVHGPHQGEPPGSAPYDHQFQPQQ